MPERRLVLLSWLGQENVLVGGSCDNKHEKRAEGGRKRTLGGLKAYLRPPRTSPIAILFVEIGMPAALAILSVNCKIIRSSFNFC
jgi:hypothetical protein